jgi:predicted amidophosphoribosyltransferase
MGHFVTEEAPEDEEPPCPACGAQAPLVDGACPDCGLQLS